MSTTKRDKYLTELLKLPTPRAFMELCKIEPQLAKLHTSARRAYHYFSSTGAFPAAYPLFRMWLQALVGFTRVPRHEILSARETFLIADQMLRLTLLGDDRRSISVTKDGTITSIAETEGGDANV